MKMKQILPLVVLISLVGCKDEVKDYNKNLPPVNPNIKGIKAANEGGNQKTADDGETKRTK